MKSLGVFSTILAIFLLSASVSLASQYGPYKGAKPAPGILIDKMVGVPYSTKGGQASFTYVDNLTTSDHRFAPQDYVYFKLRVKNTSDKTLHNVVIRDFAPEYVDLLENPGIFDGRDMTINVGTLQARQEMEYILKARVQHQDKLPADKALICVVNRARVSNPEIADEDSAQFCIEKKVLGKVPAVPEAGAAEGILITMFAAASAYTGLKLNKASSLRK